MTRTSLSICCWLVVIVMLLATVIAHENNPKYSAWGGGGVPCGLFLTFDKFVFSTEKTIPIRIKDVCELHLGKSISATISDPDRGIDNSTGRALITPDSMYLAKQIIVSGKDTQVVFEPPRKETKAYRFLVTLTDDRNEITDQKIIFTKEGADVVRVSDIAIPENVSAGSTLEVRATITDSLGNPVAKIVRAHLVLQRPECVPNSYPSEALEFELRTASSTNPTKYIGRTALPLDFPSGLYKSSFSVFSDPSDGYLFPTRTLSEIRIENGGIPITALFYNIEELNGTTLSKPSGDARYALGDDIIVKGQVLTDDCQPLSGINIVGDFYGYSGPLIRTSTVSDSAGNFSVHFQTHPRLQVDTQYFISLRGNYANNTYTWNDDYVFLDDVKKFPFEIDGKGATAEVMTRNEDSRVISFELDEDSKKITIVLESNGKGQTNYQIGIPSDLLSGDMIIRKVGSTENPLMLTGTAVHDSVSGPFLDPKNELLHSYSLSADKHDGFTAIGYSDEVGGRATIEITGTSVIPEYGSVTAFAVAIAIVSSIIAAKQFRNRK